MDKIAASDAPDFNPTRRLRVNAPAAAGKFRPGGANRGSWASLGPLREVLGIKLWRTDIPATTASEPRKIPFPAVTLCNAASPAGHIRRGTRSFSPALEWN
jgi:hypothetical protein